MGPVVPEGMLTDALVALLDRFGREVNFFRTLLPYGVAADARRSLEAAGFTLTTKTTHRLDLSQSAPAIW